jgi:shikimate kinase
MILKPDFLLDGQYRSVVTLIGMSGVGKSSIGRVLAKRLQYRLLDSDRLIEKRGGGALQALVDRLGDEAFVALEETVICGIKPTSHLIIATGGSVIYSQKAMAHLKSFSLVVYFHDDIDHIKARISNMESRGIVGLKDKGFDEVYLERVSLYRQYADVTVNLSHPFNLTEMTKRTVDALKEHYPCDKAVS